MQNLKDDLYLSRSMSDIATAKMGARQMRNQQIKDPKKKKMMKVKKSNNLSRN